MVTEAMGPLELQTEEASFNVAIDRRVVVAKDALLEMGPIPQDEILDLIDEADDTPGESLTW